MRLPLAICLALMAVSGCAQRPAPEVVNDPWQSAEDPQSLAKARAAMERIDEQLKAAAALPPPERLAAQTKLGPDLADAAAIADGTKLANRAYWLLAQWRIHFNNGKGAEDALNKLDACKDSGLKQLGRMMRIELLLREGRLVQARAQAERLAKDIPDFAGILAIVGLYEQVGKTAPKLDGLNATGEVITLTEGTNGRAYVIVFVDKLNPDTIFFMKRYQAALGSRGVLVGLVTDTGPAQMIEAQPQLPGALLLRGGSEERLTAWRNSWGILSDQCVVVVDGAGMIAAVQIGPSELAVLPALNAPQR